MKVLVVEDQESMANYLKKGLGESGYSVDVFHDGALALSAAISRCYDLVILDGMLPGMDGWNLVRNLRAAGKQTPTLFLSARDDSESKIRGLELGADVYLVKPFSFSELLAQIRSLLRRQSAQAVERLEVGDLILDVMQHKAFRGGLRLDLTPKEFSLLSLLIRRRGEVLSRTFIAEQIWNINFDTETNVVDVHVRRLRSKIDDPFDKKLIRTVRGFGYSLEH